MRRPPASRLDRLLGVAVLVLAIGALLPFAFRGWIPHDEGMLGQLGQRTRAGELPHIDFDDPYTGGLSFLYAGAFSLLGERLATIRWVLLAAVAFTVPFLWALARRLAPPWLAALAVFVALAWTVPNYFAGLPSWYNLFAALIALELLLRAGEARPGARLPPAAWLALAGAVIGLSCVVKVTGLYLLAAAILILIEREGRDARAHDGHAAADAARGARGVFLAAMALGGAAFVALLVLLVRQGLASGRSGPPASVLAHFVLPGAALVAYLVGREATRPTAPFTAAGRLRRQGALALPLLAGWSVPVGALLALYAARGGLDDLWRGVFVLPRLRFEFATFPLPPVWSLLAAAPVGALLAWPGRGGGARPARTGPAGIALAAVLALALGAVFLAGGRAEVYRAVWLPLRALLPVAVIAGLLVLARRPSEGNPPVFPFLAVAAMTALIQYPDAYGIYFFYTVPPLVLALLAVAAANPRAPRAALLAVLVFAGAFAGRWLNGADPLTYGLRWQPARWDFALDLPRGGLVVDRRRGAEATAVVLEVLAHAAPGEHLLAAPDSPEVAFLAGMRNPSRSFFEFFDPAAADPAALAALLDRYDVRVVVVNLRPSFSPPFPPAVAQMLRRRYPDRVQIGDHIVLWR